MSLNLTKGYWDYVDVEAVISNRNDFTIYNLNLILLLVDPSSQIVRKNETFIHHIPMVATASYFDWFHLDSLMLIHGTYRVRLILKNDETGEVIDHVEKTFVYDGTERY